MTSECIIFMVGVIIQISSTHQWAQFAVGRLISGLGVGALSSAVPMYQAETAPPPIRGSLTATYQLFITLGILVACESSYLRNDDESFLIKLSTLQTVSPSAPVTCPVLAHGKPSSALASSGP